VKGERAHLCVFDGEESIGEEFGTSSRCVSSFLSLPFIRESSTLTRELLCRSLEAARSDIAVLQGELQSRRVRENALVEQVQALERRLLSVEFSAKTEPPSLKRRASSPPPLVARTGANAAFEQSAIELEELGAFPLFFHLVTASPLTKLICPLFYSSRVKEHGLSLILSSLRRVS
jgi:hypothetical protein